MTTQECPKCGPVPDVELFGATADQYRRWTASPSDHSRFQRRLVPIEPVGGYEATIVELDEASDWMGPATTTTIDVPDGYEVVVLPTGTVDHCAKEWGGYVGQMGGVGMACREAVARRQSATERVPWWEAVGRGLAGSKIEILEVGMDAEGPWVEVDLSRHPHRMHSWVDPSGMVEVEL